MKTLIIVPAGDDSLHTTWSLEPYYNSIVNLFVVYYGTPRTEQKYKSTYYLEKQGAKWTIIKAAILYLGPIIYSYDYIWIPDDDLAFLGSNRPAKLSYIVEKYNLLCSQPALTGYITHSRLSQIPSSKDDVIYSYFVEIMCPLFEINFFKEVVYNLIVQNDSQSGWGYDFVWSYIIDTQYSPDRIGIINSCPVVHTRKPHKVNEGFYKKFNIDPFKELNLCKRKYKIPRGLKVHNIEEFVSKRKS